MIVPKTRTQDTTNFEFKKPCAWAQRHVIVQLQYMWIFESTIYRDGSRTEKGGSWELEVQEVREQGMGSVNLWVILCAGGWSGVE